MATRFIWCQKFFSATGNGRTPAPHHRSQNLICVDPYLTPGWCGWTPGSVRGVSNGGQSQWVLPFFRVATAEVAFDAALMAAMDRPWPDIVFVQPSVAASGMTPADLVNP